MAWIKAKNLRLHLGLILAGASLVGVAYSWPFRSTSLFVFVGLLGTLFLGVVLTALGLVLKDHPRLAKASPLLEVEGVPLRSSAEEVVHAAALLTDQREHTERIIHEVEPRDGYLINKVTRLITLPRLEGIGPPRVYYVPLGYFTRGMLIDDLVARCDQWPIRIMASSSAASLTFELLVLLTERDFGGRRQPELQPIFEHLLPVILADGLEKPDDDVLATRAPALLALQRRQESAASRAALLARSVSVTELWVASMLSYIIFGEVRGEPGTKVAIETSYKVQLGASGSEDASFSPEDSSTANRMKDRLRAIVGVSPHLHRFALQYEGETKSYHLAFKGPEDQYVSHVDVQRSGNGAPAHLITMRSDDSSTIHYRHIQVRPLRKVVSTGQLAIRFGMTERPPGLLGLVALVGFVQLVFEAIVLIYYDRVFHNPGFRADVATVLLAAPAIVAGWMANQISPGRLQRMPLAAVLGIAFNGASAVFFTVLALLATIGLDPGELSVSNLHIRHAVWVFALGVAVWATSSLATRWLRVTIVFVRRLRQPSDLERFAR